MREHDEKPDPPFARRQALRVAGIAALVAGALVLGHYGPLFLRAAGRSSCGTETARTSGVRVCLGDKGRDAPDIPPPPRSKRQGTISSGRGDDNAGFRYHSSAPMAVVVGFYDAEMPKRGWRERGRACPKDAAARGVTVSYSNSKGFFCIIAVTETQDGTGVTILRTRPAEPRRVVSAQ